MSSDDSNFWVQNGMLPLPELDLRPASSYRAGGAGQIPSVTPSPQPTSPPAEHLSFLEWLFGTRKGQWISFGVTIITCILCTIFSTAVLLAQAKTR